jgi:rRNA maturation RNase YbeY
MAEVDVTNQTPFPVSADGVAGAVSAVLDSERVNGAVDVAFLPVETMAELNERYRGVAGATDVLSYPGGVEGDGWPEPPDVDLAPFLGDVLICPAVAQRHSREDGLALGKEILHLLVHGTLHLLGYDHEVDEGEMQAREESLRSELSLWSSRLVVAARAEAEGEAQTGADLTEPSAGGGAVERRSLDS